MHLDVERWLFHSTIGSNLPWSLLLKSVIVCSFLDFFLKKKKKMEIELKASIWLRRDKWF